MNRADAHFVECSPGQYEVTSIKYVSATTYQPAVPDSYKYTYISENGTIWGIPVTDTTILTLDVDGVAINEGGGIVSVPCTGHPFVAGDVLRFSNSAYINAYTLTAGTTASRIHFTAVYSAETFDGTEVPQKVIASLDSSAGHMVRDSSGNLYYGHNWNAVNGTYVTKIETDGTLVYDFLNPTWPVAVAGGICAGLAITPDDLYLYIWIFVQGPTDNGYMEKYDLTTGDLVWQSIKTWPQYDIGIDSSGNVYAAIVYSVGETIKFASADGAQTTCADSLGSYGILVDNDLGILVSYGYNAESNNLWVSDLADLSSIAKANVGGTALNLETGCVVSDGQYIYVLAGLTGSTLYKYDATLTLIASVAGPTYGRGLYIDLWGNLVVVNQDATTGQTELLWFYDTDLNHLDKIKNIYAATLASWAALVGGSWVQGDAVFNGALDGTPEVLAEGAHWELYTMTGGTLDLSPLIGETVCILADGVVYPSQVVDDNGHIDASAFSTATKVHIGLNYESKLRPMKPVSQPDMMSAVVTCKQMGISVHNTDDIKYGVHDDDMKAINFDDVQWKNKCEIDGLFTGTVAVSVPDGFSVNLPLQITTDAPLPCTVRAMIPKVD